MSRRTLLILMLHVAAVLVGAAAEWWFVLPDDPGEAIGRAFAAGTVATYAEVMAMRWGW